MTVLLTRPAEDSARIAAKLAGQGICSMTWPLMEIWPVGDALDIPDAAEAVLDMDGRTVLLRMVPLPYGAQVSLVSRQESDTTRAT